MAFGAQAADTAMGERSKHLLDDLKALHPDRVMSGHPQAAYRRARSSVRKEQSWRQVHTSTRIPAR